MQQMKMSIMMSGSLGSYAKVDIILFIVSKLFYE